MILDSRSEFADATALNTGAAGAYLVGNVIDTVGSNVPSGATGHSLGKDGRPVFLVIAIDTAVTSAGAATVQFKLVSDAQAALATDGTATEHWVSAAIAKATLIAGYNVAVIALPLENPAYERYVGILQVTGTAALTAGKFNAFLTADPAVWKAYSNGIAAV
jgi:hypothetical protein